MNIRENTPVFTANDEKVGHVDRVVVDPVDKEITHIVVKAGFIFTEDTVVPMDYVHHSDKERVILTAREEGFDDLPPFMETDYVTADEDTTPEFVQPTYASTVYYYAPLSGYVANEYNTSSDRRYVNAQVKNIPEGTIVLEEGMDVVSSDGDVIGSVGELKFESTSDQITAILVESGIPFFKDKKIIPTRWIHSITDDHINLAVTKNYLERLPEYSA